MTQDFGDATETFARAVGRVTATPFFETGDAASSGQRLLHVGLSGSALYAGDKQVRYRARPESHLAPYVVDTGNIAATGAYAGGVELAWVEGPLGLQAEYLHNWVSGADGPDASLGGGYVSASWFLTGESRPYNPAKGTFGRVVPRRNFNPSRGGWGAWELAGRWSRVNLEDGSIQGGRITMLAAGVNWYLHSHVKWRFDYGFGHVTDRPESGNLNIFQTRMELDF